MSIQIFKKEYPKKDLLEFLDKYSEKKCNYYFFTKTSFKKANFDQAIGPFCYDLKKYYYSSKQKYLDKIQNYRSFITIIRQICKYHQMGFASKMIYDKSKYEIVYYIFFA